MKLCAAYLVLFVSCWAQRPLLERSAFQQTSGWCSPAVANVAGNVTIVCNGVSPKALERLNRELSRRTLSLQQKLEEAEEFAQKFRELEQRLKEEGDQSKLSLQAAELIAAGELEEADQMLEQIEGREERHVNNLARVAYSRGQVAELRFREPEALPHYEKAYRNRPDNVDYGFRYAYILQKQKIFETAEQVHEVVIRTLRKLQLNDHLDYQSQLARSLNAQAILYGDTGRLLEAERLLLEVIKLRTQLAQYDGERYERALAFALNNLGTFYQDLRRLPDAQRILLQALDIHSRVAHQYPDAEFDSVAILTNLGSLYNETDRPQQAEAAYLRAYQMQQQLADHNPAAHEPTLALHITQFWPILPFATSLGQSCRATSPSTANPRETGAAERKRI